MKNILVTGGAGFIGSYLCEELLRKRHRVIAVDTADGSKIEHLIDNKNFQFIQGSVLDKDLMSREVEKSDMIFHFAAIADPKKYVYEPLLTLDIDLQATLNILNMAARREVKVVFASTSEIYGKNPNVPWKEEDDRVLGSTSINRWCYATSKAAGEHYCYAYNQQEGMPFVIIRFFNVYGPKLDDLGSGRVIPVFLKSFLHNEPVVVHGSGNQTRTFVFIKDCIGAVIKIAFSKKAEGRVFNVGTDREVTILELARIMKRVGRFRSEIKFIPHKRFFGKSYEDIPRRVPDIGKLERFVGWEAKISLEKGLKITIDYYREKVGL